MQFGIGERIAVPGQLQPLFAGPGERVRRQTLVSFFGIVDHPGSGRAEIPQRNGSGADNRKKGGGKQKSLEHKFSLFSE